MNILGNLKKPANVFVAFGVALLFFDVQYWMMVNLPGSKNLMCIAGGNLTALNVIFSTILAILSGILVANLIEIFRQKAAKAVASSVGGFSLLAGSFTIFCPLCIFPVISIFGLSIGLSFFTTFDIWIKFFSVFLMLLALYIVEKQLQEKCEICVE